MVGSRDSSPLVWCSSRCSRGQTDALEQIEIKKVTQLQVTRLSQFASMSRRRRRREKNMSGFCSSFSTQLLENATNTRIFFKHGQRLLRKKTQAESNAKQEI